MGLGRPKLMQSVQSTMSGASYLFITTADWPFAPFATAKIDQFLPHGVFRLLRQAVVGAWKLSTEDRLLPTVTTNGTAALFVDFGLTLRCHEHRRKGAQPSDGDKSPR